MRVRDEVGGEDGRVMLEHISAAISLRFPPHTRCAPPPLWGRVGEGGGTARVRWRHLRKNRATPTPNPSPQGGGERTESVAREKRCARLGVTALSFAGVARAAMLACNDHNGFAVIAHGPHCDHRADAVRGGAGARAAGGHDRAGSACGYKCTAACSDSARAGRSLEKRPSPQPSPRGRGEGAHRDAGCTAIRCD